ALTNVLKHAGATTVSLRVACESRQLVVSLTDDGRCDAEALAAGGGRGLAIMRARSEELGATFSLSCVPGCQVVMQLALDTLLPETA
ncbi:MAG: ATP-binding protein, partial [Perlucidibaca sp.]